MGGTSRAELPGVAAGKCGETWGQHRGQGTLSLGELVTGAAGLRLGLPRGGANGQAARRQVRYPDQARTGNPPQRPRELAAREGQWPRATGRRGQPT
jgi:hypothetical protein